VELAHRLEEARTSAKLLEQTVTCTAPAEFLGNELIAEFADRCRSASRSIQGYMQAENPAPDNDTMESLIDTHEQLQKALAQYQRALLNAKRQAGLDEPRSNEPSPSPGLNGPSPGGAPPPMRYGAQWSNAGGSSSRDQLDQPPPVPSRAGLEKGKGKAVEVSPIDSSSSAPMNGSSSKRPEKDMEDPFADPPSEPPPSHATSNPTNSPAEEPRLAFEPYHPGFTTTPSYLNRQESATNKIAMHGAASPPTVSSGGGNSAAQGTTGQSRANDDDDIYDNEAPGGSSSRKN
jgi:hypothetical protein